jgi:hypothetical protein
LHPWSPNTVVFSRMLPHRTSKKRAFLRQLREFPSLSLISNDDEYSEYNQNLAQNCYFSKFFFNAPIWGNASAAGSVDAPVRYSASAAWLVETDLQDAPSQASAITALDISHQALDRPHHLRQRLPLFKVVARGPRCLQRGSQSVLSPRPSRVSTFYGLVQIEMSVALYC